MSVRFEVLLNGDRVCMSGINGEGVLSAIVNYVKHANEDANLDMSVSGLGKFNTSYDRPHHAGWATPSLKLGDEVTIRILPAGDFEDPEGMTQSPQKTIEDPDLGTLRYHVDAWDGDIDLDFPPLTRAHIHLAADESGPSDAQRTALLGLLARRTSLWPEIGDALIRCHPELKQMDDLNERVDSHIGINMLDDTNAIGVDISVCRRSRIPCLFPDIARLVGCGSLLR